MDLWTTECHRHHDIQAYGQNQPRPESTWLSAKLRRGHGACWVQREINHALSRLGKTSNRFPATGASWTSMSGLEKRKDVENQ